LSNEISDGLTISSSMESTTLYETKCDGEEFEDVSLQIEEEELKGVGCIAEREITLQKFTLLLKIKRSILFICYLLLFTVEIAYFSFFSYFCICPLLLSLSYFAMLTFDTNLFTYLHKRSVMRLLFILSMSLLNILSITSFIAVYSTNFNQMHHFNHNQDYCFKFIIFFNILSLFCFFCMDLDIIAYSEHSVYAYKMIFFGIVSHERYQIDEMSGNWFTKRKIFQHPSSQFDAAKIRQMESNKTQPIGIWQKLAFACFIISMLGNMIFTIHGIESMQPYIH